VLGPYGCSKELADVSTADLARSGERDNNAFCRQGYGTLLARLAAPLPLLLSTPVKTIEWWSRARIEVETTKGQFKTGLVILTVSTNVLTSGKIKLAPDLPKRHLEAATKLKLGSRDHVALELTGNPLGLRSDELVLEKAGGRQTAAIFGNMSGSTICVIDIGGNFGRDLSAKGEAAMIDFAINWLGGLYGTDMKGAVKRRHATRWNNEPWVLGAVSAAAPGAQSSRKILAEPISNRIFLAGEATHETLWGTVNGAWESGERAADTVVKLLGGPSKRG
jgi:monoamine oxidase